MCTASNDLKMCVLLFSRNLSVILIRELPRQIQHGGHTARAIRIHVTTVGSDISALSWPSSCARLTSHRAQR